MKKRINLERAKCLYTINEWKTFEIGNLSEYRDYDEEYNQIIRNEVMIRYYLGNEDLAKIVINELKFIQKKYNFVSDNDYGRAFEIFAISVIHNLDYQFAKDKYIVNGSDDGGIDAVYFDDKDNYIYQIKMGSDFEVGELQRIKNNYTSYKTDDEIHEANSSNLKSFLTRNKEEVKNPTKNMRVRIITSKKIDSSILGNDEIISPKEIYEKYFKNKFINKKNGIKLILKTSKNYITLNNDMYIYISSAQEFIDSLFNCNNVSCDDDLYKYFFDNVRGNIIKDNVDDIDVTIKDNPENFIKYNNGITITGEIEKYDSDSISTTFKVEEPTINNGQQTIWHLVKYKGNLNNVKLLIILKNETDENIKSNISRYTNTQKRVSNLDLMSIKNNVRSIQEKLFDKYFTKGWFLETVSSGKKVYSDILKQIHSNKSIIKLSDFLKLYYSLNDKKKLGRWKSSISSSINEYLDKEDDFDFDQSILVCETILKYNNYINGLKNKDDVSKLKHADLSFMYIMAKYNYSADETAKIIDIINDNYFRKTPSTSRSLNNLYKSDQIIEYIEEAIKGQDVSI